MSLLFNLAHRRCDRLCRRQSFPLLFCRPKSFRAFLLSRSPLACLLLPRRPSFITRLQHPFMMCLLQCPIFLIRSTPLNFLFFELLFLLILFETLFFETLFFRLNLFETYLLKVFLFFKLLLLAIYIHT